MIEKKLALLQHLGIEYFEYEGDYIRGVKEEFEVQFQEYLKDNEEITFEKYLIEEAELVEDYIVNVRNNYYDTHLEKYLILNNDEAEDYFDEYLEQMLDEVEPCSRSRYFDRETWKEEDVKSDSGRGLLSTYDGKENEERVEEYLFFIYRIN